MTPAHDDRIDLDGEFLLAGDESFERARAIENARLVRRPRAIAKCASVRDVQAALAYAREHGLRIAVRSGGHSAAGWSSVEDGLIIDLTLMRSVVVDPESRTARVGGGVLATDVVSAAYAHGLAPVTGIHGSVGLGGLLLGLGEGYLTGRYGFGVDNVAEVEMVTADGELRTLSEESDPDLFWAVRGAGANFGVVTAMTLILHPVPATTLGGTVSFEPESFDAVADYVWNLLENASLDSWPSVCFTLGTDGTPRVAVTLGHVGDEDEGLRELSRLRNVGAVVSDTTSQMTYPELISEGGAVGETTLRPRAVWNVYRFDFDGDVEAQKRLVLEQQRRLLRSPATYISLWRTPEIQSEAPDSAAPRHPGISVFVRSMWDFPADDDVNLAWFARTTDAFARSGLVASAANTINHVSQLDDGDVLRRLYGDTDFARLTMLKTRFDPENFFSSNANITPLGGAADAEGPAGGASRITVR